MWGETVAFGVVIIGSSQLCATPIAIVCLKVVHALAIHAEPQDMRLLAVRTVEVGEHSDTNVLVVWWVLCPHVAPTLETL